MLCNEKWRDIIMATSSIKEKYCKGLISWGLIKFWGPINTRNLASKTTVDYSQKHSIRISDINMVRGFN
jgi:hypothetical protein